MTSQKKSSQALVRLSGSGYLFARTLYLKYTKVLLNHTWITVVLSGMACRNS